MARELKCTYSHCKCPDEPLTEENVVRSGKWPYHKDCFEEKEAIKAIIEYYVENFDKEPIFKQLRQTINRLVYDNGKSPEFILFAMRYAKTHGIGIYHPPGLFYVMKDKGMLAAWEEYTNKKRRIEVSKIEFAPVDDLKPIDGYNNSGHRHGWAGKIISKGV